MLSVLSPAKTLDFDSKSCMKKHSEPRMLRETSGLVEVLRTKSADDLQALMGISEEIATLNVERFRAYEAEHTRSNAKPAVLAFDGDVYRGLEAGSFDARDFTESQKTLRILSGLYGILRPLDLIQPYRLEMGTKLSTIRGDDLYEWWGTRITDALRRDLDASPGANVLVNLASNEYFKAVQPERLGGRVISPRFEDRAPDGTPRVVSFHAKRARGAMAGWLVRNRVRTTSAITQFDGLGYRYDEERSTKDQPVFIR